MSDTNKTPLETAQRALPLKWRHSTSPACPRWLIGTVGKEEVLIVRVDAQGSYVAGNDGTLWNQHQLTGSLGEHLPLMVDDDLSRLLHRVSQTLRHLEVAAARCREPNPTTTAGFTEAQQRFLERWAGEVENHVTPPEQPYPERLERDGWADVHAPHRPPGHVDDLLVVSVESPPTAEDYALILVRVEEYHTMNPPPEGFKMDDSARLWSELRMLSAAASALVEDVQDCRRRPDDRSPPSGALTRRLTKRLQHAQEALDRHKQRFPVPVHISEKGEAVLMLTSSSRGHVVPVPVRLIEDGVRGVKPMYHTQSSPSRMDTDDRIYIVRETVEDIRATLMMLAEREGGEE